MTGPIKNGIQTTHFINDKETHGAKHAVKNRHQNYQELLAFAKVGRESETTTYIPKGVFGQSGKQLVDYVYLDLDNNPNTYEVKLEARLNPHGQIQSVSGYQLGTNGKVLSHLRRVEGYDDLGLIDN